MAGKYTCAPQQRLIKLVLHLFGDVVAGFSPTELAKAVGASSPTITRDLDNLETAGIVRMNEQTGRWILTQRLPQQAIKVWAGIDRAEQELQEAKQRFTRTTF